MLDKEGKIYNLMILLKESPTEEAPKKQQRDQVYVSEKLHGEKLLRTM